MYCSYQCFLFLLTDLRGVDCDLHLKAASHLVRYKVSLFEGITFSLIGGNATAKITIKTLITYISRMTCPRKKN